MDLKAWGKLNPEEQQAYWSGASQEEKRVLIEADSRQEKRWARETSKCSAGLLELRNAIKLELDEEGAAGHKYADMAAKFTHLKEPQKADMLRLISQDELIHQAVLHGVVDLITEECGE